MTTKPAQLLVVFRHLDAFATKYTKHFIHIHELSSYAFHWNGDAMSNEKTLLELKNIWDDCINFLVSLQRKYHCSGTNYDEQLTGQERGFRYTDLVAAHIEMAVESYNTAMATPAEKHRPCEILKEFVHSWMIEQANLYVDNLAMVQNSMQRRNPDLQADGIRDAWWTVILKGIVWKYSVQPHFPPGRYAIFSEILLPALQYCPKPTNWPREQLLPHFRAHDLTEDRLHSNPQSLL